jgi:hypothetical protein
VSGVLFASRDDGWLYGTGLWFTRGAGASWLASGKHLRATADGAHWHQYPAHCPESYTPSIAAASRSHVTALCYEMTGMFYTNIEALNSANGGKTMHLAGKNLIRGDPNGGFAVPPGRPAVLTMTVIYPAHSRLLRSANGGRTWAVVSIPGSGGADVSSLSYVSRAIGWVVSGQPGIGSQLLCTTNTGITWHNVPF